MKQIDIFKAASLPGWMSANELTWLAHQAQTASVTVEVGSHVGRSTRAIADHTEGKLITVDDFYGPRDTVIAHSERMTLLKQFEKNLQDSPTAQQKRLWVWAQDHSQLTPELIRKTLGEEFKADFIFIDGHHEYPNVKQDVSNWLPFLQDGGLISGHDYSGVFPGVVKAVAELLPQAQPVDGTTIWHYRKI